MCLRPAPIDSRTAISVERRAARPSSRLATFPQQISSTIIVTLNSSVSGCRDCSGTLLCPRAPGSS